MGQIGHPGVPISSCQWYAAFNGLHMLVLSSENETTTKLFMQVCESPSDIISVRGLGYVAINFNKQNKHPWFYIILSCNIAPQIFVLINFYAIPTYFLLA